MAVTIRVPAAVGASTSDATGCVEDISSHQFTRLKRYPSKEVKKLVGPVGKAAIVKRRRDKKDDKKDKDVIEHKGAAVAAHRRRD